MGLLRLVTAGYGLPLVVWHGGRGDAKRAAHTDTDGEVDHTEAFVLPIGAVAHQIHCVSGTVRAQAGLRDTRRQLRQTHPQHPQQSSMG